MWLSPKKKKVKWLKQMRCGAMLCCGATRKQKNIKIKKWGDWGCLLLTQLQSNNIRWQCCLMFAVASHTPLSSLQLHLLHLYLFHQPLSFNCLRSPPSQRGTTFVEQTFVPTLILFVILGRPFCGIGINITTLVLQWLHRWMRVVNDPREFGYGPATSRSWLQQ